MPVSFLDAGSQWLARGRRLMPKPHDRPPPWLDGGPAGSPDGAPSINPSVEWEKGSYGGGVAPGIGPAAPMGDGGGGSLDADYRAIGLPAIQGYWAQRGGVAAAKAYWDSHPELAANGFSDWSPYKW